MKILKEMINKIANYKAIIFLKLFINILLEVFEQKKEFCISLIIFIIIMILTYFSKSNNKILYLLDLIINGALSVFITIVIIDICNSYIKVQNKNKFELTKNIMIEIIQDLILSTEFKTKEKCEINTDINSRDIEKTFNNFKIITSNEKTKNIQFLKFLFENYNASIEMLLNWIFPNFYKTAITNSFINSINQLEFEIQRLKQYYELINNKKNNNIQNEINEDCLNRLTNTLSLFWTSLYDEYNKFYKN